jgi:hypothetical protein
MAIKPREISAEQKQAVSYIIAICISIFSGSYISDQISARIGEILLVGFVAGRGSNLAHSLLGIIKGFADTVKVKKIQ